MWESRVSDSGVALGEWGCGSFRGGADCVCNGDGIRVPDERLTSVSGFSGAEGMYDVCMSRVAECVRLEGVCDGVRLGGGGDTRYCLAWDVAEALQVEKVSNGGAATYGAWGSDSVRVWQFREYYLGGLAVERVRVSFRSVMPGGMIYGRIVMRVEWMDSRVLLKTVMLGVGSVGNGNYSAFPRSGQDGYELLVGVGYGGVHSITFLSCDGGRYPEYSVRYGLSKGSGGLLGAAIGGVSIISARGDLTCFGSCGGGGKDVTVNAVFFHGKCMAYPFDFFMGGSGVRGVWNGSVVGDVSTGSDGCGGFRSGSGCVCDGDVISVSDGVDFGVLEGDDLLYDVCASGVSECIRQRGVCDSGVGFGVEDDFLRYCTTRILDDAVRAQQFFSSPLPTLMWLGEQTGSARRFVEYYIGGVSVERIHIVFHERMHRDSAVYGRTVVCIEWMDGRVLHKTVFLNLRASEDNSQLFPWIGYGEYWLEVGAGYGGVRSVTFVSYSVSNFHYDLVGGEQGENYLSLGISSVRILSRVSDLTCFGFCGGGGVVGEFSRGRCRRAGTVFLDAAARVEDAGCGISADSNGMGACACDQCMCMGGGGGGGGGGGVLNNLCDGGGCKQSSGLCTMNVGLNGGRCVTSGLTVNATVPRAGGSGGGVVLKREECTAYASGVVCDMVGLEAGVVLHGGSSRWEEYIVGGWMVEEIRVWFDAVDIRAILSGSGVGWWRASEEDKVAGTVLRVFWAGGDGIFSDYCLQQVVLRERGSVRSVSYFPAWGYGDGYALRSIGRAVDRVVILYFNRVEHTFAGVGKVEILSGVGGLRCFPNCGGGGLPLALPLRTTVDGIFLGQVCALRSASAVFGTTSVATVFDVTTTAGEMINATSTTPVPSVNMTNMTTAGEMISVTSTTPVPSVNMTNTTTGGGGDGLRGAKLYLVIAAASIAGSALLAIGVRTAFHICRPEDASSVFYDNGSYGVQAHGGSYQNF